jgi:hypothetical protein
VSKTTKSETTPKPPQHQKRVASGGKHGLIVADQADHERRWVALKKLRWGGGWIEPGELVPNERGRNYEALWRLGSIAPAAAPEQA